MIAWMIYGANGYTGRLIAQAAVDAGMQPVLAGRSRRSIRTLAEQLGCRWQVFPLKRVDTVAEQLASVRAVLNCAGPFSATAPAMLDACLRSGVDYLDVTGEIEVIEAAAARHEQAQRMAVSLIPAVGFDVVPSDCLASMLAERLPGATRLQLGFQALLGASPGTVRTTLEGIARGGRVRSGGEIVEVPLGARSRELPFPNPPRQALCIPWGDVASAWHSTGIGDIEVYAALPGVSEEAVRRMQVLLRLLRWRPIRALVGALIRRGVRGPTAEQRSQGESWLWGRVEDPQGHAVEALLRTPEAYQLTVLAALVCVQRVLGGDAPKGFATPSRAFGRELILEIPGTSLQWL